MVPSMNLNASAAIPLLSFDLVDLMVSPFDCDNAPDRVIDTLVVPLHVQPAEDGGSRTPFCEAPRWRQ